MTADSVKYFDKDVRKSKGRRPPLAFVPLAAIKKVSKVDFKQFELPVHRNFEKMKGYYENLFEVIINRNHPEAHNYREAAVNTMAKTPLKASQSRSPTYSSGSKQRRVFAGSKTKMKGISSVTLLTNSNSVSSLRFQELGAALNLKQRRSGELKIPVDEKRKKSDMALSPRSRGIIVSQGHVAQQMPPSRRQR